MKSKSILHNVEFNIVMGCNCKDYPDGNAAIAWEKLKNKGEPILHIVEFEIRASQIPDIILPAQFLMVNYAI
jgi:hypothetical protein